MATLKAHGREVARAVKDEATPESAVSHSRRTEHALMEDGKILEKLSFISRDGLRKHDYGWTRYASLKAGSTAQGWIEKRRNSGWRVQVNFIPQTVVS